MCLQAKEHQQQSEARREAWRLPSLHFLSLELISVLYAGTAPPLPLGQGSWDSFSVKWKPLHLYPFLSTWSRKQVHWLLNLKVFLYWRELFNLIWPSNQTDTRRQEEQGMKSKDLSSAVIVPTADHRQVPGEGDLGWLSMETHLTSQWRLLYKF